MIVTREQLVEVIRITRSTLFLDPSDIVIKKVAQSHLDLLDDLGDLLEIWEDYTHNCEYQEGFIAGHNITVNKVEAIWERYSDN